MPTGQSKVPEPRTEEESVISYRLRQVENAVVEMKEMLEDAELSLLKYKVEQLESTKNKIIASVAALALLVLGRYVDIYIFGGK